MTLINKLLTLHISKIKFESKEHHEITKRNSYSEEPMKRFLLLFSLIVSLIIVSCCPEPKELTEDEVNMEKQAVINVVKAYNKAVEEKNFSKIVPTLAGEVIFFGTDSSEVIKTFADFKKQMMAQWNEYDNLIYGELADVSIQMDKNASFASIIFGLPVTITKGENTIELYLRVARTLKKEKEVWVIVSGIVGAARPDNTLKQLDVQSESEPEA